MSSVGGASVDPMTREVRPLPAPPAPVVAGASEPPAVLVAGARDEPVPSLPLPLGDPLLLSLPQAANNMAPAAGGTAAGRRGVVTVRWGDVRMTVGLLRSWRRSSKSRLV